MIDVTIQVPESLAAQLALVRERLPEVLAHGLHELSPLPNHVYRYILDFLASAPSSAALLQFGPSPEMQARVEMLLEKQRSSQLTPHETEELDEYVQIDHLITMLKARALPFLHVVS